MSLFTKVAVKVPKRNAFGLSAENHMTANLGALYPSLVQECFPGDDFRIKTEASIKLAPLVFPVMGRIDVYFHTFFVPHRLLYDNWEKFITGGETGTFANGGETTDANGNPIYVAPYYDFEELFNADKLKAGDLCDYLGLPSLGASGNGAVVKDMPPISALPMLAYEKIYSDWYRDELLDANDEFVPVTDGKVTATDFTSLRWRCWHKDYFTSARPETQLGPEVGVPITGNISADGPFRLSTPVTDPIAHNVVRNGVLEEALGVGGPYAAPLSVTINGAVTSMQYGDGLSLEDADMLINNLRRALKLQEWQEKNMRGGNRYIENIFHHFGVKSSDARLQRSQYLGGKKVPVVVGEIPQSVDTTNDTAYNGGERYLGERGGIANAAGSSKFIHKFCEEHGFIITIMSILPHASYQQGVPRYFGARWDRFDYLWPEFGNLGEQEVKNWELYVAKGVGQGNDETFGYQSRYADMKYTPSGIHGEFRTNLTKWHNGRIFASRPSLNSNFVHFPSAADAGGQNRIFAVTSNDNAAHFYCHLYNHVSVLRMLPKYGIPSI